MSPHQLATCRQWPGPAVALHPGLSAVHTDNILVSSFFVITSLTSGHCIECLQWPPALCRHWSLVCIMWVETPGVTLGPWSPLVTGQTSLQRPSPRPIATIIHTRVSDQNHGDTSHYSHNIHSEFLINLRSEFLHELF